RRARPHRSTLFPYTTLFRSRLHRHGRRRPDDPARRRPRPHQPELKQTLTPAPAHTNRLARVLANAGMMLGGRTVNAVVTMGALRSEEHTSELQSRENLVCRL